jgi:hypothetical protein
MFGRRSTKKLPATVATGLSLLQGGDRDGALRAFAEASHTNDPNVLRALGAGYQQAGEDGYAEHCLRLAAQGGSRDALNDLGVLQKRQNRIEDAEQAFRQASDLGCPNASNNLGNLWETRGDMQAAAWYWHRAAEGGVPRAMVSLGIYLASTGQQAEARGFYERARNALPQAPDIRDQLDLLGTMLDGRDQGSPGGGGAGGATGGPGAGGPLPGGQDDPFGPTQRHMPGIPASGGLAGLGLGGPSGPSGAGGAGGAGGAAAGGLAASGADAPAPGGLPAGGYGSGPSRDSGSLTRMDTALTTKRPTPAEAQPAAEEHAPTMLSRPGPQLPASGDRPGGLPSGILGGGLGIGADDIDTATVRNPRFRSQPDKPAAPGAAAGGQSGESPASEVPPPEPWNLGNRANQDIGTAPDPSAAQDLGTARDSGARPTATGKAGAGTAAADVSTTPQFKPAASGTAQPGAAQPGAAQPGAAGPGPLDATVVRPGGWPSASWGNEARRDLLGEEPPTAYYRRLPGEFAAASGTAPAAQPAAEAAEPAASFDLSDNLRTVEKLRASYMDSKNVTTLRLALEINKVGVESAAADDPTAQALALSLRCTLLRLAYERDRNEAELAEAIEAGRLAKSLFKATDAGFPRALNSLATALQADYGRTRDPAILTEVLSLYREAVRMLPEGHPELPAMFSNIGNVLMTQGLAERNRDLLDDAVHSAREAVGMSDPGDSAYTTRQASLGMALVAHYANGGGAASDLDEAERLFNATLAALPAGHALRPQVQSYLNGISGLR